MIIVVMGKRGQGKSTWVRNALSLFPSWVIFDTLNEHDLGDQVYALDQLIDYFKNYPEAGGAGWRACYKPGVSDDPAEFELVCEFVYCLANVTFVVEEIDNYTRPIQLPESLRKLISYGRHRNVNLIATSRRPADVPRLLTSQAQHFVFFNMTEPRDVAYISQSVGSDLSRVRALGRGAFLYWKHGEISEGQTIP